MTSYIQKKTTMRERRQAVKRWIFSTTCRVALIIAVAIFGTGYVLQTSTLSTKGYDINALQKEVRTLEQENQQLTVEIAQYRSMQYIQSQLTQMNLVAAGEVIYKIPVGTAVARR